MVQKIGTTVQNRKKITTKLLGFVLVAGLFFSCDANRVFEDYYTSDANGWNKDSIAVFNLEIAEENQRYNLLINSRNLENYAYSNLWLFIEILSPDSTTVVDTIEYKLALPNGKWTGQGTGGVYHNQYGYRSNVFFPETGTYQVKIQHGMRDDVLKGLKDIGIRLEKNN